MPNCFTSISNSGTPWHLKKGLAHALAGIIVLLVPVFLPALYALGIDMIWIGTIVVLVIEIGLITPPIGMNIFVVKSVLPAVRLADIFRGVGSYILALETGLIAVYSIPSIATFLPSIAR